VFFHKEKGFPKMICDILSDAISDIRDYQKDGLHKDTYEGIRPAIDNVTEMMWSLFVFLECCPLEGDSPECEAFNAALADVEAEIAKVDLTQLRAAHERLRSARLAVPESL
jgi:hypothetical protein